MDEPRSYTDSKGRTRWTCNDDIARKLKRLHDFLVIGNYDESHAARYPRLAHQISRHPEPLDTLAAERRLTELPGVSDIIASIITELLESETCEKMRRGDDTFTPPPLSVLELTEIPRLGAKTARKLYQQFDIASLDDLRDALEDGRLESIPGLGKGMIATIRRHLEERGGR